MSLTQLYTLDVTDRPDVLPRVITTVRRRGGDIISLQYTRADRHRPSRLELAIACEPRQAGPMASWLEALVDVRAVRVA